MPVLPAKAKKKILRKFRISSLLPQGITSQYIQLTPKKGIKICKTPFLSTTSDHFLTTYKVFLGEFRNIKAARKRYPFIPKCYGIKTLKINGFYYVGLVLQHLGTTTYREHVKRFPYKYKENYKNDLDDLRSYLYAQGINHCDLHGENVMVYRNNYWIIDFEEVQIRN